MKRFVKTFVPQNSYKEVEKIGGSYIVHLDGKNIEGDMVECYECVVDYEPNMEDIYSNLGEWKKYIERARAKCAKIEKTKEIYEYDTSSEVNSFTYKGTEMWLDKNTRNGLIMRLNAEREVGKTETTLWFKTQAFTLTIDECLQLLTQLEVYASACYDNTARHVAAVSIMDDADEIINYDYKKGYPEKIVIP